LERSTLERSTFMVDRRGHPNRLQAYGGRP
jgi:hypothetical protein